MSRLQLALSVSDLESSVEFYSHLFGTQPHKRRPGYANFQVADPPLKLVLIEVDSSVRGTGAQGALNHLGVEVDTTAEVFASLDRLRQSGMTVTEEIDTTCCYAQQDKGWIHDPAGTPWEVYTITNDQPTDSGSPDLVGKMNDGGCCTQSEQSGKQAVAIESCC